MFCDLTTPDGEPFEGDPRSVLKRNLQRAAEPRIHLLRRPRGGVLLLRRLRPGSPRSWTGAATSTSPLSTRLRSTAARRSWCWRTSASL